MRFEHRVTLNDFSDAAQARIPIHYQDSQQVIADIFMMRLRCLMAYENGKIGRFFEDAPAPISENQREYIAETARMAFYGYLKPMGVKPEITNKGPRFTVFAAKYDKKWNDFQITLGERNVYFDIDKGRGLAQRAISVLDFSHSLIERQLNAQSAELARTLCDAFFDDCVLRY